MSKIISSVILSVLISLLFTQCKFKESNAEKKIEHKDSAIVNNTLKVDSTVSKNPTEEKEDTNITSIKFEKEMYDFGTCTEGDKILKKIEFINTGKLPLIISQAYGSCGCTVPKYNKEPVQAGKKGILEIEFDSSHKPGANTKSVMIEANTYPPITTVSFSVKVNASKKKGFLDRFMN